MNRSPLSGGSDTRHHGGRCATLTPRQQNPYHFNNIKHAPEGHIRLEMRSAAAARPVQIVVHALDELLLDARGARLVARVHEVRAEQPRTLRAVL